MGALVNRLKFWSYGLLIIVLNNRDYNTDQNNHDYDFCHNRAALQKRRAKFIREYKTFANALQYNFFPSPCPLNFSVITQSAQ